MSSIFTGHYCLALSLSSKLELNWDGSGSGWMFFSFCSELSWRHLSFGNFRLDVLVLLFQLKMEGILVLSFRSFLPLNCFLISSGRKCCSHTLVYSVTTNPSRCSCLFIAKSHRFLTLASKEKGKNVPLIVACSNIYYDHRAKKSKCCPPCLKFVHPSLTFMFSRAFLWRMRERSIKQKTSPLFLVQLLSTRKIRST